jgi:tropomyosin, fungi type
LNAKVKALELATTAKDQEITSLTHRNELLEKKLEEHEEKIEKFKGLENDESGARGERESLLRKVALLEEEAEQNDKNLRETTEKYPLRQHSLFSSLYGCWCVRLRQVDVKAEHFERKVTSLERERDALEKKVDEITEKYQAAKAELDEVNAQLDNLWVWLVSDNGITRMTLVFVLAPVALLLSIHM